MPVLKVIIPDAWISDFCPVKPAGPYFHGLHEQGYKPITLKIYRETVDDNPKSSVCFVKGLDNLEVPV
jgi:hypothetical protein